MYVVEQFHTSQYKEKANNVRIKENHFELKRNGSYMALKVQYQGR